MYVYDDIIREKETEKEKKKKKRTNYLEAKKQRKKQILL